MRSYAQGTSVSVDRSKAEIEAILRRYGADGFGHYQKGDRAEVCFEIVGKPFRIDIPMPSQKDFAVTEKGRKRVESQVDAEYEKECRRRWRAICLVLKAKLELIYMGASTIEKEFMLHMVLDNGSTVQEKLLPHINEIVKADKIGKFLSAPE